MTEDGRHRCVEERYVARVLSRDLRKKMVLLAGPRQCGKTTRAKSRANVNAIGDMGETPLHVAIRKDNRPVVLALVAAGAETNIVSEFGATAKALADEMDIDILGCRSSLKE